MALKFNSDPLYQTMQLVGVMYLIECFKTPEQQMGTFDGNEWNHCLKILIENDMIVISPDIDKIYNLTDGGKIYLQRIADVKFPKARNQIIWE